jgi:hypothetical protein
LPVASYKKEQPAEFIALVNENKILEERVLRQIETMQLYEAANGHKHDGRSISLAKTAIQDGFMWLTRAVFQPGRVALPEDSQ